eukprot:gene10880-7542_t
MEGGEPLGFMPGQISTLVQADYFCKHKLNHYNDKKGGYIYNETGSNDHRRRDHILFLLNLFADPGALSYPPTDGPPSLFFLVFIYLFIYLFLSLSLSLLVAVATAEYPLYKAENPLEKKKKACAAPLASLHSPPPLRSTVPPCQGVIQPASRGMPNTCPKQTNKQYVYIHTSYGFYGCAGLEQRRSHVDEGCIEGPLLDYDASNSFHCSLYPLFFFSAAFWYRYRIFLSEPYPNAPLTVGQSWQDLPPPSPAAGSTNAQTTSEACGVNRSVVTPAPGPSLGGLRLGLLLLTLLLLLHSSSSSCAVWRAGAGSSSLHSSLFLASAGVGVLPLDEASGSGVPPTSTASASAGAAGPVSYPTLRETILSLKHLRQEFRATPLRCREEQAKSSAPPLQCAAPQADAQLEPVLELFSAWCRESAGDRTVPQTATEFVKWACEASEARGGEALEWVDYLKFLPIEPIVRAVRVVEHEDHTTVTQLGLFYAPDLFPQYNYLQLMRLWAHLAYVLHLAHAAALADDAVGGTSPVSPAAEDLRQLGIDLESDTALFFNASASPLSMPSDQFFRAAAAASKANKTLVLPAEEARWLLANPLRVVLYDAYYPKRDILNLKVDPVAQLAGGGDVYHFEDAALASSNSSSYGDTGWLHRDRDRPKGDMPLVWASGVRLTWNELKAALTMVVQMMADEGAMGALAPHRTLAEVLHEQPSPPSSPSSSQPLPGQGRHGLRRRRPLSTLLNITRRLAGQPAPGPGPEREEWESEVSILRRLVFQESEAEDRTPGQLLDSFQRLYGRVRSREGLLAHALFSPTQVRKYRFHHNVSSEFRDGFHSADWNMPRPNLFPSDAYASPPMPPDDVEQEATSFHGKTRSAYGIVQETLEGEEAELAMEGEEAEGLSPAEVLLERRMMNLLLHGTSSEMGRTSPSSLWDEFLDVRSRPAGGPGVNHPLTGAGGRAPAAATGTIPTSSSTAHTAGSPKTEQEANAYHPKGIDAPSPAPSSPGSNALGPTQRDSLRGPVLSTTPTPAAPLSLGGAEHSVPVDHMERGMRSTIFLLQQNPPMLLFSPLQGSRPVFFPQTLLRLRSVDRSFCLPTRSSEGGEGVLPSGLVPLPATSEEEGDRASCPSIILHNTTSPRHPEFFFTSANYYTEAGVAQGFSEAVEGPPTALPVLAELVREAASAQERWEERGQQHQVYCFERDRWRRKKREEEEATCVQHYMTRAFGCPAPPQPWRDNAAVKAGPHRQVPPNISSKCRELVSKPFLVAFGEYHDQEVLDGVLSKSGHAMEKRKAEMLIDHFFLHDEAVRIDPSRLVESAPLELQFFLTMGPDVVQREILLPLSDRIASIRRQMQKRIALDALSNGGPEGLPLEKMRDPATYNKVLSRWLRRLYASKRHLLFFGLLQAADEVLMELDVENITLTDGGRLRGSDLLPTGPSYLLETPPSGGTRNADNDTVLVKHIFEEEDTGKGRPLFPRIDDNTRGKSERDKERTRVWRGALAHYLLENHTAYSEYLTDPLNVQRFFLMRRLRGVSRLSAQAHLVLLQPSQWDYEALYFDTLLDEAVRRGFHDHVMIKKQRQALLRRRREEERRLRREAATRPSNPAPTGACITGYTVERYYRYHILKAVCVEVESTPRKALPARGGAAGRRLGEEGRGFVAPSLTLDGVPRYAEAPSLRVDAITSTCLFLLLEQSRRSSSSSSSGGVDAGAGPYIVAPPPAAGPHMRRAPASSGTARINYNGVGPAGRTAAAASSSAPTASLSLPHDVAEVHRTTVESTGGSGAARLAYPLSAELRHSLSDADPLAPLAVPRGPGVAPLVDIPMEEELQRAAAPDPTPVLLWGEGAQGQLLRRRLAEHRQLLRNFQHAGIGSGNRTDGGGSPSELERHAGIVISLAPWFLKCSNTDRALRHLSSAALPLSSLISVAPCVVSLFQALFTQQQRPVTNLFVLRPYWRPSPPNKEIERQPHTIFFSFKFFISATLDAFFSYLFSVFRWVAPRKGRDRPPPQRPPRPPPPPAASASRSSSPSPALYHPGEDTTPAPAEAGAGRLRYRSETTSSVPGAAPAASGSPETSRTSRLAGSQLPPPLKPPSQTGLGPSLERATCSASPQPAPSLLAFTDSSVRLSSPGAGLQPAAPWSYSQAQHSPSAADDEDEEQEGGAEDEEDRAARRRRPRASSSTRRHRHHHRVVRRRVPRRDVPASSAAAAGGTRPTASTPPELSNHTCSGPPYSPHNWPGVWLEGPRRLEEDRFDELDEAMHETNTSPTSCGAAFGRASAHSSFSRWVTHVAMGLSVAVLGFLPWSSNAVQIFFIVFAFAIGVFCGVVDHTFVGRMHKAGRGGAEDAAGAGREESYERWPTPHLSTSAAAPPSRGTRCQPSAAGTVQEGWGTGYAMTAERCSSASPVRTSSSLSRRRCSSASSRDPSSPTPHHSSAKLTFRRPSDDRGGDTTTARAALPTPWHKVLTYPLLFTSAGDCCRAMQLYQSKAAAGLGAGPQQRAVLIDPSAPPATVPLPQGAVCLPSSEPDTCGAAFSHFPFPPPIIPHLPFLLTTRATEPRGEGADQNAVAVTTTAAAGKHHRRSPSLAALKQLLLLRGGGTHSADVSPAEDPTRHHYHTQRLVAPALPSPAQHVGPLPPPPGQGYAAAQHCHAKQLKWRSLLMAVEVLLYGVLLILGPQVIGAFSYNCSVLELPVDGWSWTHETIWLANETCSYNMFGRLVQKGASRDQYGSSFFPFELVFKVCSVHLWGLCCQGYSFLLLAAVGCAHAGLLAGLYYKEMSEISVLVMAWWTAAPIAAAAMAAGWHQCRARRRAQTPRRPGASARAARPPRVIFESGGSGEVLQQAAVGVSLGASSGSSDGRVRIEKPDPLLAMGAKDDGSDGAEPHPPQLPDQATDDDDPEEEKDRRIASYHNEKSGNPEGDRDGSASFQGAGGGSSSSGAGSPEPTTAAHRHPSRPPRSGVPPLIFWSATPLHLWPPRAHFAPPFGAPDPLAARPLPFCLHVEHQQPPAMVLTRDLVIVDVTTAMAQQLGTLPAYLRGRQLAAVFSWLSVQDAAELLRSLLFCLRQFREREDQAAAPFPSTPAEPHKAAYINVRGLWPHCCWEPRSPLYSRGPAEPTNAGGITTVPSGTATPILQPQPPSLTTALTSSGERLDSPRQPFEWLWEVTIHRLDRPVDAAPPEGQSALAGPATGPSGGAFTPAARPPLPSSVYQQPTRDLYPSGGLPRPGEAPSDPDHDVIAVHLPFAFLETNALPTPMGLVDPERGKIVHLNTCSASTLLPPRPAAASAGSGVGEDADDPVPPSRPSSTTSAAPASPFPLAVGAPTPGSGARQGCQWGEPGAGAPAAPGPWAAVPRWTYCMGGAPQNIYLGADFILEDGVIDGQRVTGGEAETAEREGEYTDAASLSNGRLDNSHPSSYHPQPAAARLLRLLGRLSRPRSVGGSGCDGWAAEDSTTAAAMGAGDYLRGYLRLPLPISPDAGDGGASRVSTPPSAYRGEGGPEGAAAPALGTALYRCCLRRTAMTSRLAELRSHADRGGPLVANGSMRAAPPPRNRAPSASCRESADLGEAALAPSAHGVEEDRSSDVAQAGLSLGSCLVWLQLEGRADWLSPALNSSQALTSAQRTEALRRCCAQLADAAGDPNEPPETAKRRREALWQTLCTAAASSAGASGNGSVLGSTPLHGGGARGVEPPPPPPPPPPTPGGEIPPGLHTEGSDPDPYDAANKVVRHGLVSPALDDDDDDGDEDERSAEVRHRSKADRRRDSHSTIAEPERAQSPPGPPSSPPGSSSAAWAMLLSMEETTIPSFRIDVPLDTPFAFGRSRSKCTATVEDRIISRIQFTITRTMLEDSVVDSSNGQMGTGKSPVSPGGVTVITLKDCSTYGTYVNVKKIGAGKSCILHHNSVITFRRSTSRSNSQFFQGFRFLLLDSSGNPITTSAPPSKMGGSFSSLHMNGNKNNSSVGPGSRHPGASPTPTGSGRGRNTSQHGESNGKPQPRHTNQRKVIEFKIGEEMLGKGGNAEVFLGMNFSTGALIAVKRVPLPSGLSDAGEKKEAETEEDAAKRAQNKAILQQYLSLHEEINVLSKATHPNIVRYIGASQNERYFNILLEFVPGGSLRHLLDNFGALSAGTHKADPAVKKTPEAGAETHKEVHSDGHQTLRLGGTLLWTDPALFRDFEAGKPSVGPNKASDIWSVGCTIIEMISGFMPWFEYEFESQEQIINLLKYAEEPPEMPEIPECPALVEIGLQCVQLDPAKRPTCDALLEMIEKAEKDFMEKGGAEPGAAAAESSSKQPPGDTAEGSPNAIHDAEETLAISPTAPGPAAPSAPSAAAAADSS